MTASVVVATFDRADLLSRLLTSLAAQTTEHQVVVVDNGSTDETPHVLRRFPDAVVVRHQRNEGFARAVNRGAHAADGDVLVLVNNDCVCDTEFVGELTAVLDPRAAVVMAAGVLRDARNPSLVDTAGMELDSTLLPFDYLNGEPVTVLDRPLTDPIGPCAAAAAFDREAFLALGGFDENLFAYWEDVDLVLRLHREGGRCRLAARALGTHEHSATLGPGSARKNYLTGFGRGYVLARWNVMTPRRLPRVLARDAVVCAGQAVVDRNVAGVRGRVRGYRIGAALPRRPYPADVVAARPGPGAAATLIRRARRRARLLGARRPDTTSVMR